MASWKPSRKRSFETRSGVSARDTHSASPTAGRRGKSAFSMAEMMIALVILGLGLLFIAAALPVGVEYTRQTVEQGQAEAAADFALSVVEMTLRTSFYLAVPDSSGGWVRQDFVFRPRGDDPTKPTINDPQNPLWVDPHGLPMSNIYREMYPKVRPLISGNIDMTPGSATRLMQVPDSGEWVLTWRIPLMLPTLGVPNSPYMHVEPAGGIAGALAATKGHTLTDQPVLSAASRVYPPIPPDLPMTVTDFFANPYRSRPVLEGNGAGETLKLAERQLVWTAFYRRVAHSRRVMTPSTPPKIQPRDGDATLYEIIVVVARRPTPQHRFARQDPAALPSAPRALAPLSASGGTGDRLFPEPWLISFLPWQGGELLDPPLVPGKDYRKPDLAKYDMDRELLPGFQHPGTIRLRCSPLVGAMLPVGSVIVPLVNDTDIKYPGHFGSGGGFVPHAPECLPTYRVVQRPAPDVVVVASDGLYPWVAPGISPTSWLCWVIPPSFTERDSAGQPVFDARSPVLAVARRFVRLPEMH